MTESRRPSEPISKEEEYSTGVSLADLLEDEPHHQFGVRVFMPNLYPGLMHRNRRAVLLHHHTETRLLQLGFPAFVVALRGVMPHYNYVELICDYQQLAEGGSSIVVVCGREHRPRLEFRRIVFGRITDTMDQTPEEYALKRRISFR